MNVYEELLNYEEDIQKIKTIVLPNITKLKCCHCSNGLKIIDKISYNEVLLYCSSCKLYFIYNIESNQLIAKNLDKKYKEIKQNYIPKYITAKKIIKLNKIWKIFYGIFISYSVGLFLFGYLLQSLILFLFVFILNKIKKHQNKKHIFLNITKNMCFDFYNNYNSIKEKNEEYIKKNFKYYNK